MFYPLLNFVSYIGMIVVSLYSVDTLSSTIQWTDKAQMDLINKLDILLAPLSPFGFTLSVWIIIYGLLLIFVTIGIINLVGRIKLWNNFANKHIQWLFSLSCILNSGWIIASMQWRIWLSAIGMVALLMTLISISTKFQAPPWELRWSDKYIFRPTFSLYLGWISVATIANIWAWLLAR